MTRLIVTVGLNFFRLNLHNCLSCVYKCDGQSCLRERGGKNVQPRPENRISVPRRGSFQNVRRAPPSLIREFPQGAEAFYFALIQVRTSSPGVQSFAFAARHIISSCSTHLIY